MAEPAITIGVKGSSGLKHYAGVIDEEWLQRIRGPRLAKVLREFSDNCPIAGRALRTLQLLMRQPPLRVVEASSSSGALRAAEFLEECLADMRPGFNEVDAEANDFIVYGHSLFELDWKYRRGQNADVPSRYNDGRIGIGGIHFRAQETLDRWDIDVTTGAIKGVLQVDPMRTQQAYLALDKCVLFRLDPRKNSPIGRSILRNALVDYWHKKSVQQYEGIGVEHDFAGVPWMQAPPNVCNPQTAADQTAYDTITDMLSSFKQNEQAFLLTPSEVDYEGKPTGYKFQLVGTPGSKQYDTDKIIRRCEQRIAIVMFDELALLGTEKVGSYSLHDSKTSLVAMAVGALLKVKAETWQKQLVEPLMRVNQFRQEDWPHVEYGDIEQVDANILADSAVKLVQAGIIPPTFALANRLCEALDLPELHEDDVPQLPAPSVDAEVEPTQPTQPAESQPTAASNAEQQQAATLSDMTLAVQRLNSAAVEARNANNTSLAEAMEAKVRELLTRI